MAEEQPRCYKCNSKYKVFEREPGFFTCSGFCWKQYQAMRSHQEAAAAAKEDGGEDDEKAVVVVVKEKDEEKENKKEKDGEGDEKRTSDGVEIWVALGCSKGSSFFTILTPLALGQPITKCTLAILVGCSFLL